MFLVQDGTVAYGPFPTREEAERVCEALLSNPQLIDSGSYAVMVLELHPAQEVLDKLG
jgi:hypothetical protein